MAWREWPLVAFTLLSQLATGLFLFSVVPAVLLDRSSAGPGNRGVLLDVLAAVIALLIVAAAASFFHLGRPLRAPNALSNLRTSWLSREILFELGFLFFLVVLAWLVWRGKVEGGQAKTATVCAAACGILFLISMARLYMVPGSQAWNRAATPFSFLATTAVLGSLGGLTIGEVAALAAREAAAPGFVQGPSWPRTLAVLAAAFILLSIVGHVLVTPSHGLMRPRAVPALKPTFVPSAAGFALRLILLTGGGVALVAALGAGLGRTTSGGGAAGLAGVAFGLAAASELIARLEFYSLVIGRR